MSRERVRTRAWLILLSSTAGSGTATESWPSTPTTVDYEKRIHKIIIIITIMFINIIIILVMIITKKKKKKKNWSRHLTTLSDQLWRTMVEKKKIIIRENSQKIELDKFRSLSATLCSLHCHFLGKDYCMLDENAIASIFMVKIQPERPPAHWIKSRIQFDHALWHFFYDTVFVHGHVACILLTRDGVIKAVPVVEVPK